MDIELWKSFFEVGGVALLFLTFAFGAGFMLTGKKVNERQSERLRKFDGDLTEAQTNLATQKERAATAEGKIAGLQQAAADAKAAQQRVEIDLAKQQEKTARAETTLLEVAKRQRWRWLEKGALSSALKGKATGTVNIEYEPDNVEAFEFGMNLLGELSDAGWMVPTIERIPEDSSLSRSLPPEVRDDNPSHMAAERNMFPITMRAGAGPGLTLLGKSIDPKQPEDGPFKVLVRALIPLTASWGLRVDTSLPENTFILIVGPKP